MTWDQYIIFIKLEFSNYNEKFTSQQLFEQLNNCYMPSHALKWKHKKKMY